MKNWISLVVALMLVTAVGASAAQRETKQSQTRVDACQDVLDGEDFTLTGIVVSFKNLDGLVLATDEGLLVQIYGIGPAWYWKTQDVERPEVGDRMTVDGRAVTLASSVHYIAFSITLGEDTIELRSPDTGCPLWRGGKRK